MFGFLYMDRRRFRRLVLITIGIGYAMWRMGESDRADRDARDLAGRLLDIRLARGDISPEDYRRVRDALDRKEAPATAPSVMPGVAPAREPVGARADLFHPVGRPR